MQDNNTAKSIGVYFLNRLSSEKCLTVLCNVYMSTIRVCHLLQGRLRNDVCSHSKTHCALDLHMQTVLRRGIGFGCRENAYGRAY